MAKDEILKVLEKNFFIYAFTKDRCQLPKSILPTFDLSITRGPNTTYINVSVPLFRSRAPL